MGLEKFDRYVIEATIGEGGMGQVYRAHDPRLGRTVAVKVLRAGAGEEDATWLLREARLAAQLEHPNVVRVYDSGESEGRPFIVMEYVRGTSLRAMATDPTVTLERKLKWLVAVARALAAAHARGLVHRDVKPSNVMVSAEDDVAKVLDFGIARHIESSAIDGPTFTGQLVGTPQYMAPEQMRGEPVDGRADQFAWGVMAYALLTGKTPWSSSDPRGLAFAVMNDTIASFADGVPKLDRAVETIVLRTLEKRAADRFTTTDELVLAFEAAMQRSSLGPEAGDATVTSYGSEGPAPNAPTSRAPAPAAAPRRLGRWLAGSIALGTLGALGLAAFLVTRHPAKTASALTSAEAAAPTARNVPVTDLPVPASSQEPAIASYRAGMQAYRDGQPSRAKKELDHALTKDPGLTAAHLRLAILLSHDSPNVARDHLASAVSQRSTLGPHDQQLLRALTPVIQDNPSNYAEAAKRLREALVAFPKDADFAYWLAVTEMFGTSPAAAPSAFDAVLAIDPEFGMAHSSKIAWLASLGRFDEALHAVDTCLAAVPSSALCVRERASIAREHGDCDALERDARLLTSIDKTDTESWYWRAEAEAAHGALPAVISEDVRKALVRRAAPELGRQHADYSLAILGGDLGAAETTAKEHVRNIAAHRLMGSHAQASRALVDVLAEEGDASGASAVANDFLQHEEGWELDPRSDPTSIARDPKPVMLASALRGHLIDDATFTKERDAWAATWRARMAPRFLSLIWAHGWAATAENEAQAGDALAALPAWGGAPPPFTEGTRLALDVGRTYLLAGKPAEAKNWLHVAATACIAVERPIAHVQAQYLFGRAAEAARDDAAACTAWRAVTKAWGHAPHSVTARAAKVLLAKLHCAP